MALLTVTPKIEMQRFGTILVESPKWSLFTWLIVIFISPQGVVLRQPQEPKEVWGYVEVRSKAHMFWWLYYANNPTRDFTELPLVLWLQVRFGE